MDIEGVLPPLPASPPIEIEAVETSREEATGGFADFTVLWSGNEGILEKLDVGFRRAPTQPPKKTVPPVIQAAGGLA